MAAAAGAGAVATSPFVVLGEALASLSAIQAEQVAVLAKLAKLMPELSRLTSVDARVSGRKRKNRVEKDPDAPRRPPNGYLLFSEEMRNAKAVDGTGKELLSKIGQTWKALPEEEKAVYNQRAAAMYTLYRQKLDDYRTGKASPEGKRARLAEEEVHLSEPVSEEESSEDESSTSESESSSSSSSEDEAVAAPPAPKSKVLHAAMIAAPTKAVAAVPVVVAKPAKTVAVPESSVSEEESSKKHKHHKHSKKEEEKKKKSHK